jgi:hypothetical protein
MIFIFVATFSKFNYFQMENLQNILYNAFESSLKVYINVLKQFEYHKCWSDYKHFKTFNSYYVSDKLCEIIGINNFLIQTENTNSNYIEDLPNIFNSNELITILNYIMKAAIDSITEFTHQINKYDITLLQTKEYCTGISSTFLLFHSIYNDAKCLKNKIDYQDPLNVTNH